MYSSEDQKSQYKVGGEVNPEFYDDASHASEKDRKSRTGILAKIAGCAIGARSVRQKIVTKSPTQAELVALSESITNVLWLRHFLREQGYKELPPTMIREDNKSCIELVTKPKHGKQRTRHLDVRYFYAKELIEQKIIDVQYIETKQAY
jgi:hypothetical protein